MESADLIGPGEEHLKITAREDFLLRAAAVNNNAGVALDYFCERVRIIDSTILSLHLPDIF